METKTVIVQFRATESEHKKIKQYAKLYKLTVSEAVRGLIGEKLFYFDPQIEARAILQGKLEAKKSPPKETFCTCGNCLPLKRKDGWYCANCCEKLSPPKE